MYQRYEIFWKKSSYVIDVFWVRNDIPKSSVILNNAVEGTNDLYVKIEVEQYQKQKKTLKNAENNIKNQESFKEKEAESQISCFIGNINSSFRRRVGY